MATASRRCMVFKCGKTSKDRNLSFHSFPKREEIREQWVLMIKLNQPGWSVPSCSSSKYYAICSRHFERNCFRTMKHKFDVASRNTLKPDAIPTLYMNGPSKAHSDVSIPTSDLTFNNSESPKESITDKTCNSLNETDKNGKFLEALLTDNEDEIKPSLEVALVPNTPSVSTVAVQQSPDDMTPKRFALTSRRCMVIGCGSTSKDRRLSFHAFPKKPDIREEWLMRINVSRPNWSSPNWPESNYYAICSRHFEPNCFKTMKHKFNSTSRNTLRPDAIPTLYLTDPLEPSSNFESPNVNDRTLPWVQLPTENGQDESCSFQPQDYYYASTSQKEDYNSACSLWTPSMPDVYSESQKGECSPGERTFTTASTQTETEIPAVVEVPAKRTRTVRIQTSITSKKSVQCKETQYEPPTELQEPDKKADELFLPESSDSQNFTLGKMTSVTLNAQAIADFRASLLSLFKSCPMCSVNSTAKILEVSGAFFRIHQPCQNT